MQDLRHHPATPPPPPPPVAAAAASKPCWTWGATAWATSPRSSTCRTTSAQRRSRACSPRSRPPSRPGRRFLVRGRAAEGEHHAAAPAAALHAAAMYPLPPLPAGHAAGRRLQNLGGLVHKKGLIPAPLPSWLTPLMGRLAGDTGAFGEGGQLPNHVLINAYQPGEGIMPHEVQPACCCNSCSPAWKKRLLHSSHRHTHNLAALPRPAPQDGPLYHPVVVILSLQHPAVVRFARKRSDSEGSGERAFWGSSSACCFTWSAFRPPMRPMCLLVHPCRCGSSSRGSRVAPAGSAAGGVCGLHAPQPADLQVSRRARGAAKPHCRHAADWRSKGHALPLGLRCPWASIPHPDSACPTAGTRRTNTACTASWRRRWRTSTPAWSMQRQRGCR